MITSLIRSRFFWNLYLTYALLVVVTSASIGFIVHRQMEAALLSDIETSRVSIPLETVSARLQVLRASIVTAAGIGVLAALALGVLAGHRLTRPIYQEQAQLRSMVGGIPVGLLAVDGADCVLFANPAACQMLGANEDKIVGQKLHEVAAGSELPDLARKVRENVREHTRENGSITVEIELTPRSQEIIVSANASRFEGGGPSSVVVVLEDITSLKRLERIRRDFVANVSHEIKTPLTSIKGYVETLIGGALFDQQNNMRFLRKVEDHVGRLTNLVQDLLSLARIEATEASLRLSETDWRPVVEGAVRRYERALQSRGLTCSLEFNAIDCVVIGDMEAMTQVLDNLIDNAIKYTPPPGGIAVRLYRNYGPGTLTTVSLAVADSGIGIPAGDMERIFERFYRVDKARSREMGGTGLGLAIVKHLVQAMHGEVRVESESGRGSEFTVTLPAARA